MRCRRSTSFPISFRCSGYLDEAILLPLGILLVVRMIPPDVMAEHRAAARLRRNGRRSIAGAIFIVAVWIALTVGAGWLVYRWLS